MSGNFDILDEPEAESVAPFETTHRFVGAAWFVPTRGSKEVYQEIQDALSSQFVLPTKGRQHFAAVNEYECTRIEDDAIIFLCIDGNEEDAVGNASQFAHPRISDHWYGTNFGKMVFENEKLYLRSFRQFSEWPRLKYCDPMPLIVHNWTRYGRSDHVLVLPEERWINQTHFGRTTTFGVDELLKLVRLVTYGREQLNQLMELQSFATQEIQRLSDKKEIPSSANVLEEFDGFVDQIDDGTAFVTLTSESGEELIGEYPANDLAAFGIRENRRFKCRTVIIDGVPDVQFEAIPDVEITPDEEAHVRQEIREKTSGGFFDGDY